MLWWLCDFMIISFHHIFLLIVLSTSYPFIIWIFLPPTGKRTLACSYLTLVDLIVHLTLINSITLDLRQPWQILAFTLLMIKWTLLRINLNDSKLNFEIAIYILKLYISNIGIIPFVLISKVYLILKVFNIWLKSQVFLCNSIVLGQILITWLRIIFIISFHL